MIRAALFFLLLMSPGLASASECARIVSPFELDRNDTAQRALSGEGLGSNRLEICDMDGLTFLFSLGETLQSQPEDADTIVLRAEIFRGRPDGFHREIDLLGFDPANDRIVIEVPREFEGQARYRYAMGAMELNDVFVTAGLAMGLARSEGDRAIFELVAEGSLGSEELGDATPASASVDAGSVLRDGGLFCEAVTAFAGDSADPNADALLILGQEEEGTRFFGYDVWFSNGHNCRASGRFTQNGDRWTYQDATCALELIVTSDGVTVQANTGSCTTGCGTRANLSRLSAEWTSRRTSEPQPGWLQRMDEVCTMVLPAAHEPSPAPSGAETSFSSQAAEADAFTLPEAVAIPFRAQRILNTLGYSLGAIDGQFGPRSRAALEAFSSTQGQPTSTLTPEALALLERAFAGRSTAPRSDDPVQVVRDLYVPTPQFVFAFTGRPDWFTPDTLDLIAAAEIAYTHRTGIDGFDWNPIVPGNAFQVTEVAVELLNGNEQEADVLVRFRSFDQPVALTYTLHRSLGQWRIHDIALGQSSLRADLDAQL